MRRIVRDAAPADLPSILTDIVPTVLATAVVAPPIVNSDCVFDRRLIEEPRKEWLPTHTNTLTHAHTHTHTHTHTQRERERERERERDERGREGEREIRMRARERDRERP